MFLSMQLFNVNAQVKISDDFSYTVSEPYKVVDGRKVYFNRGEEVLSIKFHRGMFYFQKFSGDKLNEEKRVEVPKMDPGFTFEAFIEYDERYYFFYSRWDREKYIEQLFYCEIDFDNLGWASEENKIIKVEGKISGGYSMYGAGRGKFSFATSYDESKLIIQYRLVPKEKRDAFNFDKIGMHVYQGHMEEMWSETIDMPYSEKKMNNIGYSIDSKGNTYVLAEVFKTESTRRVVKGVQNFDIELIRIDAEDQSIRKTRVTLADKFISNIGFFEGENGEMVIAGYYSVKSINHQDGVFIFKLDEEGEVAEKISHEIPVEVMSMYMSKRKQDKMKKKDDKKGISMNNVHLRSIIYNKDGSITMYGEVFYITTTTDPNTGATRTTYYYKEIIATHIDAEGEISWMTKLPKNQVGKVDVGSLGFYVYTHEGTDFLLFLDNVNNIELPMDKYPKAHKDGRGGFLTGFKIDKETGDVQKISILNTLDAKGTRLYQFRLSRIINLSDGSIALEVYIKQKKDVMLRIKLND